MSLITTIEHAYAVAIADIKKVGNFTMNTILPVLQKAEAAAPTIEAVTSLVSPQLASIERTGEAVLAIVIKAVEDAVAAGNSGGVNISLDSALVADIKSIIPAVKASAPPVQKP